MNDVTSPLCSGACTLGLWTAGAFFHDIYPALSIISACCGSVLGLVGIIRLSVDTFHWLRRRAPGEDRLD